MEIKNISHINPDLTKFLFESRVFALRNTYNGFRARVFNKAIQKYYYYITLMPNCSNGNMPIDFLNEVCETEKSYIVLGSLAIQFPNDEFHKLYDKNTRLISLDISMNGYMDLEKVQAISSVYYDNPFSEETIQKMIIINSLMQNNYNCDSNTFIKNYYQYYAAVESARRLRLETLQMEENIGKQIKFSRGILY